MAHGLFPFVRRLRCRIQAASRSAFPQVRNVATIGGNIAAKGFAEADLVRFTKSDLYRSFPRLPGAAPRPISARTGEGVAAWLEEVLSHQGDLKERLKFRGERDLVVAPVRPTSSTDKFCPACNRRLALLEAMARRLSEEELETWRR